MDKLKVGDTVKLKSGGPVMTIEMVFTSTDKTDWGKCVWLTSDNEVRRAEFSLATLERVA